MLETGRSQRRIERTLNAAYAHGLLSEDTFLQRTDELLGGGVIDPSRLVGDLNFRRGRGRPPRPRWVALIDAIDRVARSWETPRDHFNALLALDWSGAQAEMLIGRDHDCDVVLSDLSVSRRHARLCFRDGRWILQDLGSKNGTVVNGARVGRCELRPGDRLRLGDERLAID